MLLNKYLVKVGYVFDTNAHIVSSKIQIFKNPTVDTMDRIRTAPYWMLLNKCLVKVGYIFDTNALSISSKIQLSQNPTVDAMDKISYQNIRKSEWAV